MDWSEVALTIFLVLVTLIIAIMLVGLHYIKKLVNWLVSPLISRTSRQ